MKRKIGNLYCASLLVLVLLMAVPLPSFQAVHAQAQLPRAETLYLESWEDPTSFNPYNPEGSAPSFLPFVEPLFVFDGWHFKAVPWLAESSEWVDSLTLRVKLREGTMWNDGQKLTADDVEYSFSLPFRRPELTGVVADLWTYLDKITVIDSRTLDFVLKATEPNKYILMQTLSNAYIVPKHVWSAAETQYEVMTEFKILENPVGSGPYKLMYASVSEHRTVWVRDENYWGKPYLGLPQPKYIVNIVSSSNEAANMIFEKGELDWSENFMPNMWEMWETKRLDRGSWGTQKPYYMPVPYMTGYVVFNHLKIGKKDALSNSEVRRAIAFAIDWNKVCDMAFSKLTTPANPSLLPESVPAVAKYINKAAVQQYGWTYDVAKANQMLDDLGYPKGKDGWRHTSGGAKLGPYDLLIVEGWTDWEAAAEIVKENLVQVGIDITVKLVDDTTYFNDIQTGEFIMTFDQPSTWTASSPWYNYYIVYVSRASPAANKPNPGYGNYGSYKNARVDELIDEIARTNPEDEKTLVALYGELQSIVMKELPYIPGWFYGPFYMYSTTYWTNWPNEKNPYSGGVPYWDTGRGWYPMLFALKSTTIKTTTATSVQTTTATSEITTTTAPPQPTDYTWVYGAAALAIILIAVAAIVIIRRRRAED